MARFKHYYNGKLLRTSKSHKYAYAVIDDSKKINFLIGCSASLESAQALISSEISRSKVHIDNYKKMIDAKENGKKYVDVKVGRKIYRQYVSDYKDYSIESFKEDIAHMESYIEHIEEHYKVVELEVVEE